MSSAEARGRAFARAALAGNPSDGFGGAVLAVVVPAFAAEVMVIDGAAGVSPPNPLVEGTVARFAVEHGGNAAATWTTAIPREVGLAGSSALVIATLRALCSLRDVEIEPDRLASLALEIERDALGIEAGLQDRVAQAYGGLTFMDFATGRYEPLDVALLPPLYLAWREDAGAGSGGVHGPLAERFRSGDMEVIAAMAELAEYARTARDALTRDDHDAFASCVDASFDVRERLVELDPRHVAMVRRARELGASANYTGSGGAIVGSCRDEDHLEEVVAGLRGDGCSAIVLSHAL